MILIDTAVWIDHLRTPDPRLVTLLERGDILGHPFIAGEMAMGSFRRRDEILQRLWALPQAVVAREEEVQQFVTRNKLFGLGIGYIDAHLLVSVQLTPDALLWTSDKRLLAVAERLGLAMVAAVPGRPN